jgi:hypothetical protein
MCDTVADDGARGTSTSPTAGTTERSSWPLDVPQRHPAYFAASGAVRNMSLCAPAAGGGSVLTASKLE